MKVNSKYNLLLSILGSIIVVVILINMLVFFEKQDSASSINTFSGALWWMVITLTTIGYGDLYPTTDAGRVIGLVFVFGSLGVLGYLISTLTSKYHTMMEEKKLGFRGTDFESHIIFIGWNEFSRMVAEEIYHTSKRIAIVTHNKDEIDLIYNQFGKENTFALFADYNNLEALEKVNVNKAAAVFISIPDDAQVLLYVLDFKQRYPNPQIVVSIENSKLKDTFKSVGVTYAVARNEIASKMVASYMFEPDVATLTSDLMTASRSKVDYDMMEYRVKKENKFANREYIDLFIEMKKTFNAILVAISRKLDGSWNLMANPPENEKILPEDYVILMCDGSTKKQLEEAFGVEEGRIIN